MTLDLLAPEGDALASTSTIERVGRVVALTGPIVSVRGLHAEMGALVRVEVPDRGQVDAEVVGFRGNDTLVMPLGDMRGIGPGDRVRGAGHQFRVNVGDGLLGRVLDGLGRPIDSLGDPHHVGGAQPVDRDPPPPLRRERIRERLPLGVRALDVLVPCGRGQRLGIFSGSGVGKSSLMGMIARYSAAEVNVICLVGERGRELRDFLERDLGEDGLARSVVICATSDQPALVRIKAALVATAIAEHFRDQGRHALLMMDSVTRLAQAQREVGLAAGEMPATRAFPPSVWAMLPRVLERAGAITADDGSGGGSITGLYTVLVEGDDMNEPVADAVRAILDGHITLDRRLAHRNHYPAIDVLQSVSRLNSDLLSREVRDAAGALRETLAGYRDKEDLVSVGAYQPGADPNTDYALAKMPAIDAFLRQSLDQQTPAPDSDRMLIDLMADRPLTAQSAPPPLASNEYDIAPAIPSAYAESA